MKRCFQVLAIVRVHKLASVLTSHLLVSFTSIVLGRCCEANGSLFCPFVSRVVSWKTDDPLSSHLLFTKSAMLIAFCSDNTAAYALTCLHIEFSLLLFCCLAVSVASGCLHLCYFPSPVRGCTDQIAVIVQVALGTKMRAVVALPELVHTLQGAHDT